MQLQIKQASISELITGPVTATGLIYRVVGSSTLKMSSLLATPSYLKQVINKTGINQ